MLGSVASLKDKRLLFVCSFIDRKDASHSYVQMLRNMMAHLLLQKLDERWTDLHAAGSLRSAVLELSIDETEFLIADETRHVAMMHGRLHMQNEELLARTHTHARMRACMHACTHACMHAHTHARTYTGTHTQARMHECTQAHTAGR